LNVEYQGHDNYRLAANDHDHRNSAEGHIHLSCYTALLSAKGKNYPYYTAANLQTIFDNFIAAQSVARRFPLPRKLKMNTLFRQFNVTAADCMQNSLLPKFQSHFSSLCFAHSKAQISLTNREFYAEM
jgi:hypothetical protein